MINFSELLWKSQNAPRVPSSGSVRGSTEDLEPTAHLEGIPVEEIQAQLDSQIVLVTDPRGPGADRFRFLRMSLRELRGLAKLQSIVVTSALPQEGKSTVALNLATALADGGKSSVLLMEADLYHPTLARRLGLAPRRGLAECLEDRMNPLDGLRRIEPLGWYLLQSGKARGNPADLFQSDALPGVMQQLNPYFDWVVIDTPPVTPLTDALSLSRQADASLLVVRADRTPREAVAEALSRIGQKHVLGIVLNGTDSLNRLYSQYYGHYDYKSDSSPVASVK
jgi:capsular exopolysaccharide synthesis family protein